jgi:hypothetical protein
MNLQAIISDPSQPYLNIVKDVYLKVDLGFLTICDALLFVFT